LHKLINTFRLKIKSTWD